MSDKASSIKEVEHGKDEDTALPPRPLSSAPPRPPSSAPPRPPSSAPPRPPSAAPPRPPSSAPPRPPSSAPPRPPPDTPPNEPSPSSSIRSASPAKDIPPIPLIPSPVSPLFARPSSPAADLILRSSDGYELHVMSSILRMSSPSFKNVKPSAEAGIVPMTETGETLNSLLMLLYPVPNPPFRSLNGFNAVLEAAQKYEMEAAIQVLSQALVSPRIVDSEIHPTFLEEDPLRVFAIARCAGLDPEADLAAVASVAQPSKLKNSATSPEVDAMPTKHWRELMALKNDKGDWKGLLAHAFRGPLLRPKALRKSTQ